VVFGCFDFAFERACGIVPHARDFDFATGGAGDRSEVGAGPVAVVFDALIQMFGVSDVMARVFVRRVEMEQITFG